MSATLLAYVDNDNVLEVDRLRDVDDAYINNATVTCTGVETAAGAVVSGDTFPKTLTFVSGSNGKYRTTLQQTLALVAGADYVAVVTVDGGGLQAEFRVPFVAHTRTTL